MAVARLDKVEVLIGETWGLMLEEPAQVSNDDLALRFLDNLLEWKTPANCFGWKALDKNVA
jgi:hypothetical protein